MEEMSKRETLLRAFRQDRATAHKYLFEHRHKDEDPLFHAELLDLLYADDPLVALMAFRGAAKSTYLEEYVLLRALFKEDIYQLVIGHKWEAACERLAPIRYELETNERIIELFGDQVASPWSTDELKLANGAKIQAVGAGQSMRGKKDNSERPTAAAIDDLEDEENIGTEESRKKIDRWLMGTLIPALHPTKRRVRFVGTAIHPKALIVLKCADKKWCSRIFPIMYIDVDTGHEKATWPGRFPLEWCWETRENYLNSGNLIEWEQEYMCRAEDIAGKPFQAKMIKVEPIPEVYMPTFMMVDPARTIGVKASRTGYGAWSWLGNKLYIRKAQGFFHKPDEIVTTVAQWNRELKPVTVGIEAVGLEEFLMQPLRVEALKTGPIPFIDIRAPKDKISFIKGLQPFYIAGDVIHVEHLPDLEQELLQFPTGRMDVLNTIAYALRMRAGRPVYEDFTIKHVAPILEVYHGSPRYLCVSARATLTAGVLVGLVDGIIKIYWDKVYNQPPQECFGDLLREAVMVGGQVKVCAPQEQFETYNNFGLPAAMKKEYITQPQRTGSAKKSEGCLRDWLRRQIRGETALLVNPEARWFLNGVSAGYARKLDKHGKLADEPTDDQYRVVVEAVECWVNFFDKEYKGDTPANVRYDYTKDGRKFISARAT